MRYSPQGILEGNHYSHLKEIRHCTEKKLKARTQA